MRKIFYCIYDMKSIFLFTVISYKNKLLSLSLSLVTLAYASGVDFEMSPIYNKNTNTQEIKVTWVLDSGKNPQLLLSFCHVLVLPLLFHSFSATSYWAALPPPPEGRQPAAGSLLSEITYRVRYILILYFVPSLSKAPISIIDNTQEF